MIPINWDLELQLIQEQQIRRKSQGRIPRNIHECNKSLNQVQARILYLYIYKQYGNWAAEMKDEKKRYQFILILQVSATDFEQSLF